MPNPFRAFPSRATLTLLVVVVAVGCMPGGDPPTASPAATSAHLDGPTHVVGSTDPVGSPSPSPLALTPTDAPTPAPTPSLTTPLPTIPPAPTLVPTEAPIDTDTEGPGQEPFAMNLAKRADFVAQYTFEWCVGASLQMAWNMSTDDHRSSRKDQAALWRNARDTSFSPFGGANPRGWVATLNDMGIGPYRLVSIADFDDALQAAAGAIRATRRPVGLVMWRGRHAWVMSGFEATADPRHVDTFEVTGIRVHDPLYPHGSSVWGKSPKPNSLISPETLAKQFVLRDNARSRVDLGVGSGYLLILPVTEG